MASRVSAFEYGKFVDGERGGGLRKSFISDLESGTGFDTRQPRSRSRRDYGDFLKYQLKYLPIDYGIIMHRMVRVDYRRAKRKKKKRADFSTCPLTMGEGAAGRHGRYLYKYIVTTVAQ